MSRNYFLSENGNSLLEVLVAATVGVLVVTALTFATIFSIRNARFAQNSAQATKLAQEGLEKVRTQRDRNIIDLWSMNCPCLFNMLGTLVEGSENKFEEIPPFKRQILIQTEEGLLNPDPLLDPKRVTSRVIWEDFAGQHESKLTTILRKI